jgi:hypothetical protein
VLDSEILGNFIESFFGYGNLSAPLWFIGMEEGGGKTVATAYPNGFRRSRLSAKYGTDEAISNRKLCAHQQLRGESGIVATTITQDVGVELRSWPGGST